MSSIFHILKLRILQKGSGGSRWRQRFVDGDQKHSRRMLESIYEVEERMKFSVDNVIEEKGSGGSRWRQRSVDGDQKHSRRIIESMRMRGLCPCPRDGQRSKRSGRKDQGLGESKRSPVQT